MKKRILAILLAVCMLLSVLAACGNSSEEPTTGNDTPAPAPTVGEEKPAEVESERTTVTWYFVGGGSTAENLERISAAGTKLLNDAGINVDLEIKFLGWGDYAATYSNMLASGEEFDIFNDMNSTFITYGLNGGIYEISDEDLATYLPAVAPAMGANVLESFRYAGTLYGVPTSHEYAQLSTIKYNADMAKEYGIDMSQVKSVEDLEPIFEKLAEHGIYGTYLDNNGNDILLVTANSDPINNNDNLCLSVAASVEYSPIYNTFENEGVVNSLKMFRKWVENGWAYPNTDGDAAAQFTQTKKVFCQITRGVFDSDISQEALVDFDVEQVLLRDGEAVRTTGDAPCSWGSAISSTCSDPVAAMKVLNFAYSNEEFIDLICYGEKDIDYTLNENGYVVINETGYGRDCGGTMGWQFSNSFAATPKQQRIDQGLTNFRDMMLEYNNTATSLACTGFYFDTTNYAAEVAAVNAVANEYIKPLMRGEYEDVEAALAEFNEALYANGLQTLIDAANEQYDAFRGA